MRKQKMGKSDKGNYKIRMKNQKMENNKLEMGKIPMKKG